MPGDQLTTQDKRGCLISLLDTIESEASQIKQTVTIDSLVQALKAFCMVINRHSRTDINNLFKRLNNLSQQFTLGQKPEPDQVEATQAYNNSINEIEASKNELHNYLKAAQAESKRLVENLSNAIGTFHKLYIQRGQRAKPEVLTQAANSLLESFNKFCFAASKGDKIDNTELTPILEKLYDPITKTVIQLALELLHIKGESNIFVEHRDRLHWRRKRLLDGSDYADYDDYDRDPVGGANDATAGGGHDDNEDGKSGIEVDIDIQENRHGLFEVINQQAQTYEAAKESTYKPHSPIRINKRNKALGSLKSILFSCFSKIEHQVLINPLIEYHAGETLSNKTVNFIKNNADVYPNLANKLTDPETHDNPHKLDDSYFSTAQQDATDFLTILFDGEDNLVRILMDARQNPTYDRIFKKNKAEHPTRTRSLIEEIVAKLVCWKGEEFSKDDTEVMSKLRTVLPKEGEPATHLRVNSSNMSTK